ncbi:hypothetical protein V2J09_008953 [Rumex salicifolius]
MKRLSSSDSLGALISICPSADQEHSPGNKLVYGRGELESMMMEGLEEDSYMEEIGHVPEKKRRLSVVQVKALEKNFEVENKLEPERKVKLAHELGLQPRQVAVWFQNRRARWKTKQLERDYGLLKASYDSLKGNFDTLHQANELLLNEIRELKSKMNTETIKQESDNPPAIIEEPVAGVEAQAVDLKDGPSDSDSSAILNEGNSPTAAAPQQLLIASSTSPTSASPLNYCSASSSSIGYLNLSEMSSGDALAPAQHYVKMEEHDFFSEETCNFYSEDQAPTLHWWT